MIHIFSVPLHKRAFVQETIQSALNQKQEVWVWMNDSSDLSHADDVALNDYDVQLKFVKEQLDCYEPIEQAKRTWSTSKAGSIAPYTDIVRLSILAKFGGWWIDDDLILLKNPSVIQSNDDLIAFADYGYHPANNNLGEYPCNYFMGSNSSEPNTTASELLQKCYSKLVIPSSERRYHEFGPYLLYQNIDKIAVMAPQYCPSIAAFDIDKYVKRMTETSWQDIMFIRSAIGLHLTDMQNHTLENDSILELLLSAIRNGHDDPLQYLYDRYHEMHVDFFDAVFFKALHNDTHGERQVISLVEYSKILK